MKTKINIKKLVLGIATVATVGLLASTAIVSAYQGDPTKQGPDFDADLHDLKVDAFDSYDYEVWKDLMEESGHDGRVLDVVNEENFNLFVDAHNAALAGDMELSNELRAELGLNNGVGPRDGTGHRAQGMGDGRGRGSGKAMRGQGQMFHQENFVDTNGDGTCDNEGSSQGMNKGMGRR